MYDVPRDLLDGFRATPDVLRAVLAGVTPAQAEAARGGDENWSVIEVLCHLRDAEERAVERTRAMRDGENPVLAGYDQDVWAQERGYARQDFAAALAGFLDWRAAHVADLEALSAADWERPGAHEEVGQITISGQVLHLVAHDCQHLAQIVRQLGQVPG